MRILIEFDLNEDVTPDYFAKRVAEACTSYYAIRPGESLRAVDGSIRYTSVTSETGALDERPIQP